MFQFPRFPPLRVTIHDDGRVSPFGYLRINAHLQLPEAFRSLSRPSSAPDAKAFPLRSFQLDLSNHLLILKVELCRQFYRIFEIVIVTHLYDVPQLKPSFFQTLPLERPLCCLAFITFFIVQFSRCNFQSRLKPDRNVQPLVRFHPSSIRYWWR